MDIIHRFIRKKGRINKEEFYKLLKKAQKGNIKARNKIIEHNLALCMYISKRGHPYEDCFQESVIGMIKAIEKFDINSGYEFSTYAVFWMRQRINRYMDDNLRVIRVPAYVNEIRRKYHNLKEENPEKTHEFMVRLTAARMKRPVKQVMNALKNNHKFMSMSLQNESGESFLDVAYIDDAFEKEYNLRELMRCLEERERYVLMKRFNNYTLQEIGLELSLSREMIRIIEKRALMRIKALVNYEKTGEKNVSV